MWARIKRFLVRLLMLPILPVLAWGPATHSYINKRALELAEEEVEKANQRVNPDIVSRLVQNRETYIFAGNSADVISSYNVLSGGVAIYDYMHNYYPDSAAGVPFFGYRLIDEWYRSASSGRSYPESDFAVACGWLSHQIADWYTHYAPIDRNGNPVDPDREPDGRTVFPGYSNSHRVLGAEYYPEMLDVYNKADHALIEFLHDMLILDRYGHGFLRHNRAELFENRVIQGKVSNLLTQTSEHYLGLFSRIPPEEVQLLKNDFNNVIHGLQVLNDIIVHQYPRVVETVRNSIDPGTTGKPDYIELSARRVFEKLFCCSREEIARNAAQLTCDPLRHDYQMKIREVSRAGTILFQLVHNLTRMIDPDLIAELIRDPNAFNIKLLWGIIDVRAGILRRLSQGWGSSRLAQVLEQDAQIGPLISFVAALLGARSRDFSEPLMQFQRRLSPLVQYVDDDGPEEARQMVDPTKSGRITVKVVPAVLANGNWQREKRLDMESLRFEIDGYDVESRPQYFSLHHTWDGAKLLLTCRLRKRLCPGSHYFRVSIRDHSSAPPGELWREFRIKTSQ